MGFSPISACTFTAISAYAVLQTLFMFRSSGCNCVDFQFKCNNWSHAASDSDHCHMQNAGLIKLRSRKFSSAWSGCGIRQIPMSANLASCSCICRAHVCIGSLGTCVALGDRMVAVTAALSGKTSATACTVYLVTSVAADTYEQITRLLHVDLGLRRNLGHRITPHIFQ